MPAPKAELVGNALQDAKTGFDKNGKPYCLVKIACGDSHKDDSGQWVTDRELFVNVRWFGANPDMRVPSKGDRVIAFGKLSQSTDTGRDGQEYVNFNCDADFIKSFEKRQQNQNGFGGQGQQARGGFGGQQSQQQSNDPWNSAPAGNGGFGGADDSEPPF